MKDRPTRPAGQVSVEPARDAAEPALSPLGNSSSSLSVAAQSIDSSPRMALQRRQMARTFGPAAGVVQRVTLDGHLDEIQQNAVDLGRWDGSFQESLDSLGTTVAMVLQSYEARKLSGSRTSGRPEYDQIELLKLLDDGFQQNPGTPGQAWNEYITVLNNAGRISRNLMQVYEYCMGKSSSHPGSASLGSLWPDASGALKGRPHFHPSVTDALKTNPKTHRRHIIAWHTLLAFVNKVFEALGGTAIDLLKARLEALAQVNDARLATAQKLVEKLNIAPDVKIMMCALYVMNSNQGNLWVGEGKENSGINTARLNILNEMGKWRLTEDMVLGVETWGQASEKTTVGEAKLRAHKFAVSILEHSLSNEASDFTYADAVRGQPLGTVELGTFYGRVLSARHQASLDESGERSAITVATEQSLLEQLRAAVDSWIVSNLDYDVGYDDQTPGGILQDRQNIVGAIKRINVAIKQQNQEIDASEVKSVLDALLA